MPLYDILNEFQKGSSHMAAVIKVIRERSNPQNVEDGEEINVEDWHHHPGGRV